MAYNASYEEADIAESIIDSLVKALITIGVFATLIVVVFMYRWARKNVKM